MAGRQTRTGAPHHRAGTAPWGSHVAHRDAPRGTDGALPPAGGVHMNGTGKTGRTATEHREVPDDGLCMQHCQGGAGKRIWKKHFTAVQPLIITFLPHVEEMSHSKNVPCRPHATGTNKHRNKQNTCTHKSYSASACCNDKEPTPNKPTKRQLTRPAHQQNHYREHDVTINRPHARRPTPNWPNMPGPVRERRPTGWRHRGEPSSPTTMPTNTAEHRNSTTADAASER